MEWHFESDRPIYAQLVEQIELRIVSGAYRAGERLPAVRDLAAQAGVNPNTMQRALAELERQELVFAQRTSGRFITEDESMIRQLKEQLAQSQIQEFLNRMSSLGFTRLETVKLLQHGVEEEKE